MVTGDIRAQGSIRGQTEEAEEALNTAAMRVEKERAESSPAT
jgi:hypothetical protein